MVSLASLHFFLFYKFTHDLHWEPTDPSSAHRVCMLWSVWSIKMWFTQPCQSQSEPNPGPLLDLSGRTLSSIAKMSAQGCDIPSSALWGKPDKASQEGSRAETEWGRIQMTLYESLLYPAVVRPISVLLSYMSQYILVLCLYQLNLFFSCHKGSIPVCSRVPSQGDMCMILPLEISYLKYDSTDIKTKNVVRMHSF